MLGEAVRRTPSDRTARLGRRPARVVGVASCPPHLSAMAIDLALAGALALVLALATASLTLARLGLATESAGER